MHHNNRTGSIAYNAYDELLGHIIWLQNNLSDSVAPASRTNQCILDLVRVLDQMEWGFDVSWNKVGLKRGLPWFYSGKYVERERVAWLESWRLVLERVRGHLGGEEGSPEGAKTMGIS